MSFTRASGVNARSIVLDTDLSVVSSHECPNAAIRRRDRRCDTARSLIKLDQTLQEAVNFQRSYSLISIILTFI